MAAVQSRAPGWDIATRDGERMVEARAMTRQAFAALMMLWGAIGCGPSRPENAVPITPVTPTPVEPVRTALVGAWTGMFDVTSCVATAFSYPSTDWCRSAGPETFSLRLDGNLKGVAEIDLAGKQRIAIDVTQSQSTDGSTILKGESTIPER